MVRLQNSGGRYRVLEVNVSATNYDEVTDRCGGWIAARKAGTGGPVARYICVTSVHGVITAHDDPEFRNILNAADIVTPDGMPLVWALRSLGLSRQPRVYGPTLMLRLCEAAAQEGHRIFLYGATPECLEALRRRLAQFFPALQIAGVYAPPFRKLTRAEDRDIQRRILDSQADVVLVGLSTPKQERWMWEHRTCFPGVVLVGVGAAFDFHAGRVCQAPSWMQGHGLEWLFRLAMEPARLWRRYLLVTPRFLPLWLIARLRASSAPVPADRPVPKLSPKQAA